MTDLAKAFKIRITGDVQGVNFRYFAQKEAEKLGLFGWAQNEHDDSVSTFIQGDDEGCQKFIEWSREGSPMASVRDVKVEEAEINEGLKGFKVL